MLSDIADVVSHTMQVCFIELSTGIQAKHLLEQAHQSTRSDGATDNDILFTSGATEGIQTVVSTLITAKNHQIENPVLLYGGYRT